MNEEYNKELESYSTLKKIKGTITYTEEKVVQDQIAEIMQLANDSKSQSKRYNWWAMAASIVIVVTAGTFFWTQNTKNNISEEELTIAEINQYLESEIMSIEVIDLLEEEDLSNLEIQSILTDDSLDDIYDLESETTYY